MSADPLEGSERARQEFEKWGNAKGAHVEQSWNGEFYENKLVESAWQGWQARGRSLEQERDELREACQWMSKALGLDAQLHAALKDLIPSPGSLSPEKHALWQKVVSVIYEAAELSDTRDTVPALRDRKF